MLIGLMRIRSRLMALVIISLATACEGNAGRAVAKDRDCPEIGSTYRPNPEHWDKDYLYRLRIDGRPLADDPTQSTEAWQFQLFERSSGKQLLTFRLMENCPAGGLCSIWLPTGPRSQDAYSNVVRLTTGFRQPTDLSAPKAIILPGFASHPWPAGGKAVTLGYLTYTGRPYFIDLRGDIVWVRVSCGHD